MRKVRGGGISMVFQDPMSSLNPVMRIRTQLEEAMLAHGKFTGPAARDRAVELMTRVGIPDPEARLADYPHAFSGGMRQRVMIAIALANQPDVLIADEPTTALDVTIQAQILELLGELNRDLGTAIVLITHNLGVVARSCQRVAVMYGGRIVEQAGAEELFAQPTHPYTPGAAGRDAAPGRGPGRAAGPDRGPAAGPRRPHPRVRLRRALRRGRGPLPPRAAADRTRTRDGRGSAGSSGPDGVAPARSAAAGERDGGQRAVPAASRCSR